MSFKVGDKVLVLDEDLSGVIKHMDGTTITIETNDGFLLRFAKHELVKNGGDGKINANLFTNASVGSVLANKEPPPKKQSIKKRAKDRYEPTLEVDLHIHQLVKSSRGMSNHEMLTLQLDTARRQLEFAMSKRIQKVVFIHGVGQGVLKLELEYLFGRYENLKYYDANYQKYGLGATEVYIYQNTRN
ncbi:Smr/MutS family protein [Cognatitamlana onchidii]|uniref:Smr/MutS family protein n=1 Tax=Cognatitamlana onchidii TaxID=2562860 RepID=UPI0010A68D91|nr:Smr/MutS family protein [Algibacter onchidii]